MQSETLDQYQTGMTAMLTEMAYVPQRGCWASLWEISDTTPALNPPVIEYL